VVGDLFDRYLDAVFTTAWYVVRDRDIAADVTRATFADAFTELGGLPAEEHEAWLLDCAHILAIDWLRTYDPGRLAPENAGWAFPEVGAPDPPGPVLRARIVSSLEMDGVPVRLTYEPDRQQIPWRLAAGAATLLLLAVVAALFVKDDPSTSATTPIDDASATTTSTLAPGAGAARRTTTTRLGTTTSPPGPTTTAASTGTTGRTTTSNPTAAPPTLPRPPGSSPPSTAPAPTQPTGPAPAQPEIGVFGGGFFMGSGGCGRGQQMVSLWWTVSGADSARVRPAGGSWTGATLPVGYHSACTAPGTVWTLEASNDGGTTRTTFTAR
jgi:hypothetical protein